MSPARPPQVLAAQCALQSLRCLQMPNLAVVLKAEISRLARKELRAEIDGLRKTIAAHRGEVASLKRKVIELERASKAQVRTVRSVQAQQPVDAAPSKRRALRFSAAGLASLRKSLGLSAADFGQLVGTTGQSIYAWEQEKSTPRPKNLENIAALRGLGKREVRRRLSELSEK